MAAFEPYAGQRKGRAWDAAAALVRLPGGANRDTVVAAMAEQSGLQRSSCESVIDSAVRAGWLYMSGRVVRATDIGPDLRPELRAQPHGRGMGDR